MLIAAAVVLRAIEGVDPGPWRSAKIAIESISAANSAATDAPGSQVTSGSLNLSAAVGSGVIYRIVAQMIETTDAPAAKGRSGVHRALRE